MICLHCREEIAAGDRIMPFNNGDVLMHFACGMRGVIGSVAHLERRCSCYCAGSSEADPAELSPRQAAEAALALWERLNPSRAQNDTPAEPGSSTVNR